MAAFRPEGQLIWLGGIGILRFRMPYVVYDHCTRVRREVIHMHAFSAHSHFHREALVMPLALGSTLGFMHFADWPALDLFQALVVVVGLVYLFVRRRDPRHTTPLLWYCVPTVLLDVMSKLVLYPHYSICFYPIQFVVVGVAVSAVIQDMKPRDRALKYVTAADGCVGWLPGCCRQ